jgi:hypothetical protein
MWLGGVALIIASGGFSRGLGLLGSAGGVLVLVSVVRWPWGSRGYKLRLARRVVRATQELEASTRRSGTTRQKNITDYLRVGTPLLQKEAAAFVSLLTQASDIREARNQDLPDRSAALVELQVQIYAVQTKITTLAVTDDEKRDVEALASVLANDREQAVELERDHLRCLDSLVSDLEQMKVPTRLQSGHREVCQAFQNEQTTLVEYYASMQGTDSQAASSAARNYQLAAQASYRGLEDLGVQTSGKLPRRAG